MSPANALFICYPQGSERAIKGSGFRVARQRLSHRLTTPTVFYVSNHDWRKERKTESIWTNLEQGQRLRRISFLPQANESSSGPLLQDAALNCRAVRLFD